VGGVGVPDAVGFAAGGEAVGEGGGVLVGGADVADDGAVGAADDHLVGAGGRVPAGDLPEGDAVAGAVDLFEGG
jgi:hypothetical protein